MSDLETSYRHCRAVVRRASSNLASTFWLLPADERRGMDALYAFARQADDLVDSDEPLNIRRQQLGAFRRAISIRLTAGSSEPFSFELRGPLALLPAVEDTVRRFEIPSSRLLELLDGVEMDLNQSSYATFAELRQYCYRVASVIGLACLPIWGCRNEAAIQSAIDCGLAFQLTNILRDIREDAERGRVYLPAEEMATFGLSAGSILNDGQHSGWQEFLHFQIARAESFFESGAMTSHYLSTPGRRVFALMLARYRAILNEIKRRGPDTLRERVQLGYPRKLVIAAGALLSGMRTEKPLPSRIQKVISNIQPTIAIIGGGLAGLAAAAALCERGFTVDLYEAKRRLGGRAGSYLDKESGEAVDHCQHVAMGCCTNFLDFCGRTEILALFERHRTLHFFGPEGQRCEFGAAAWLPAPLHLGPAFLKLSYLTLGERLSIAGALWKLSRLPAQEQPGDPTIGAWLNEQAQSRRCIERFWQVVLVSALGESLDRASLTAARKVFVDGFMSTRGASDVLIPRVPLDQLYQRIAEWLQKRGVRIHLEAPVAKVALDGIRPICGISIKNREMEFSNSAILAVPWGRIGNLLDPHVIAGLGDSITAAEEMRAAPITSLHLWFDRPLTELPHAVLVGRLSQWVFARGQGTGVRSQESGESLARVSDPAHTADRRSPSGAGDLRSGVSAGSETRAQHYYQVVISASHELVGREREDVLREVRGDLNAVFPDACEAELLRWQMITEQEAVFSVRPGLEAHRPSQQTTIPNLFLAGDWTATGWPSTMESAVRSGYSAAEAVLRAAGRSNQILR